MSDVIKFRMLMFSMVLLPLFSGVLFVVIPEFSKTNFYLSIIVIGVIGLAYGLFMLLGLVPSRFYAIIQMDLFSLFLMALTLRVYDYNGLLATLLLVLYFGSIFVASKYPEPVKRIGYIGLIGIAPGAALGILLGRILPLEIAAPLLSLAAIVILLLTHSAWATRVSPEKKNGPII